MKSKLFLCNVFAAFVWLSVHGQSSSRREGFFTVNDRKISIPNFDRKIQEVMDGAGVPAISLAVIDDGKIVFDKTYGVKQLTKRNLVNDSTLFEAASLSKGFLAFVANKLIGEGQLNLDTPMYKYLSYPPLLHDPRYKLITARMILSHCSGIENWQSNNNADTLEILSNPGEKYIYSGEGYQYLALAIEKILHMTYDDYVRTMVIDPLKLQHTYTYFSADSTWPGNYANGHDNFGKEVTKWKNTSSVPASGVNITAGDYAALIVATFDKKHLDSRVVDSMVKPRIRLDPSDSSLCFGLGFAVQYTTGDTIIFHNGHNTGFRSMVWYSVVHHRGIVMLTNSERENVIEGKINDLTVRLDLKPYFSSNQIYAQYPSYAATLLNIYLRKDTAAMFKTISEMTRASNGKLAEQTLNELGWIFTQKDKNISIRLLEQNISMHPASAIAHYLLGKVQMSLDNYRQAYAHLKRASDLGFDKAPVDEDIRVCLQKMKM